MSLRYRIGQLWQLLVAEPLPVEAWNDIQAILSPAEVALFRCFGVADQRHSYAVMQALRETGHEDQVYLLRAALLHDIGKTRVPLQWWERVAGSVAELLVPSVMERWGTGRATGWRRPFVIRAQHAAWGALMAEAAGSSDETVTFIRHHQDKQPSSLDAATVALLVALQKADDNH